MASFSTSILNNLPILPFFDSDKIILRKGSSLFGKCGPVKIPLRPTRFARLEFYRFESKDELIKSSDILDYVPFPVIPDVEGEGSWLYLHRSFGKRERYHKRVVQLSSCTFIGLFLEDDIPIACSHVFFICSKKNLKTGPTAGEKRPAKKRRKQLSEEDEERLFGGPTSSDDLSNHPSGDSKMDYEQMIRTSTSQTITISTEPIIHTALTQNEQSSGGISVMKVSHLVDPTQTNETICLPFIPQSSPYRISQKKYCLDSITKDQYQITESQLE